MGDIKTVFDENFRQQIVKVLISSSFIPTILIALSCKIFNIVTTHLTWNLVYLLGEIRGCVRLYLLVEIMLPILCNLLLLTIHSKSYSLKWWVPEKRLNYIYKMFHFRTFFDVVVITAICTVLFYHYASIANPDVASSVHACQLSNLKCINHKFFVVMIVSILYGLKISMDYVVGNLNFLNPPVVSVNSVMQLKMKINLRNIYYSSYFPKTGFCFIVTSLVAHGFIGSVVSNWSAALLGAHNHKTDAILVLFNFPLLATIILSVIAVGFHLHCFFSIFNDSCMKPIEIPLSEYDPDSTYLKDERSWNIKNGLLSKNELLRHLSLLKLRDISKDSSAYGITNRAKIFSISQPGGHPYYWEGIVTPTLSIIEGFCGKLRNLQAIENNNVDPSFKRNLPPPLFDLTSAMNKALLCLKGYPVFYFWLSSFSESKIRQLFAESQSVIYAIEGLAHLVAASYKEDKYGVVQKNIKDILTAILDLQFLVDKTGRGPNERKPLGYFCWQNSTTPHDIILKKSLRSSIRTSLYTIGVSFKSSLKDVQLDTEFQNKIVSYLNFQEG